MAGGQGNDTYYVDNASDQMIEYAAEGIDTVVSSQSLSLGANLENLTLLGKQNINGFGNELANFIRGNIYSNILVGGGGNDTLDGKAGDDVLDGGQGNDLLNGGAGVDHLTGATGDDTYVVDNFGDVIVETADEGADTVRTFINYTLGANVENLAMLGVAGLAGTGNELNNNITGNDGDNALSGAAGSDILNGGVGADTMLGGTDNDIYIVDNVLDIVTENAGEGTDLVRAMIDYVLGLNFENLTLVGPGSHNGDGNALDNALLGNRNANVLKGLGGNDLLDGGPGADSLTGGIGNDTYAVDNRHDQTVELNDEGVDTVNASIDWTLGAYIENLVLVTDSALKACGNALDNVLVGNSKDNTLTGLDGNDVLDGRGGRDNLFGGRGNDTYIVDHIFDRLNELANEGIDIVQSNADFTLPSNFENLTLVGTGSVAARGNSQDNILIGNQSYNDIYGGSGNDTLNGGGGSDLLWGDLGADRFVFGLACGKDDVRDFSASENDMIDVSAYSHGTAFGSGITITSDGRYVAVIDLGGGNTVTLVATVADVSAHMIW